MRASSLQGQGLATQIQAFFDVRTLRLQQVSWSPAPELISLCAQRGKNCLVCVYIRGHICPQGTLVQQAASSTEQHICFAELVEV